VIFLKVNKKDFQKKRLSITPNYSVTKKSNICRVAKKNNNLSLEMTEKSFLCFKCGRSLPGECFNELNSHNRKRTVTYHCKECRSNEYFNKTYPHTQCIQCLRHQKLNKNQICSRCNEKSGLRECKCCKEILPLYLMYYGKHRICKHCISEKRRTTPS
jgi:hypothetical protein